jgi:hypothetical protein
MSIAAIIFNQRQHNLTLESVRSLVNDLGVSAKLGEWRYLTEILPQVEIATKPQIALQLNDHPDVREENAELLEDELGDLSSDDKARFLECDARLEVVSGQQPVIHNLPGGGMVSRTDDADISSDETQALLLKLTARLQGFLWLNV